MSYDSQKVHIHTADGTNRAICGRRITPIIEATLDASKGNCKVCRAKFERETGKIIEWPYNGRGNGKID